MPSVGSRGWGVKRRNLMTVPAGAVAYPLLAGAQQKAMPVIGILVSGSQKPGVVRGTGSSNPSPSCSESANHRFLSYSRGAVKSAAVSEGEIAVASKEQLHSAPLSGKGLLALWNARPGIEKRKEVGDRDALIDQWAAIEASPEPEPQADAKRPPKQEKVIEMLRRPEGATVDEVVRATAWQRHTVRGVFLVRQFEEILNIWPQFASKVASASMEAAPRAPPTSCR